MRPCSMLNGVSFRSGVIRLVYAASSISGLLMLLATISAVIRKAELGRVV